MFYGETITACDNPGPVGRLSTGLSVIVPVSVVRGMTVSVVNVVDVVIMRDGDVTATLPMLVDVALMHDMSGQGAFIDVVLVRAVEVSVVNVVDVVAMWDGDVTTALSVCVVVDCVRAVLGMDAHLSP
ncbi:hypothetical protein Aple_010020 [Acrocarpospora pleiomorpha]|uniref:Uncharacterized protein n=1 Tax=Acrocarpospora pleiomorpha TaxID=90975 RepID=A0A5M3X8R5_9ACTN|nr:hypothetical protein Aple_010020 [Acrocarpospora pleiomorpha]